MIRFYFFVTLSFLMCGSCDQKEDIQRDVFLGLKLGASTNDAISKFSDLVKQGTLKIHDGQNPYYLNNTNNFKNYYSAPLILSIPGDTIVNEIKVVYLANLNELEETIRESLRGWNYMNLYAHSQNSLEVSANEIWDDVSLKLEKKYGKYDSESVNKYEQNVTKIRYWKDQNDVNIELNFLESANNYGGNSRIFLKYSYIDKINDILTKGKSEY